MPFEIDPPKIPREKKSGKVIRRKQSEKQTIGKTNNRKKKQLEKETIGKRNNWKKKQSEKETIGKRN